MSPARIHTAQGSLEIAFARLGELIAPVQLSLSVPLILFLDMLRQVEWRANQSTNEVGIGISS